MMNVMSKLTMLILLILGAHAHFRELIEELSILSRVSNAIALESTGIQKALVLAELLEMDHEHNKLTVLQNDDDVEELLANLKILLSKYNELESNKALSSDGFYGALNGADIKLIREKNTEIKQGVHNFLELLEKNASFSKNETWKRINEILKTSNSSYQLTNIAKELKNFNSTEQRFQQLITPIHMLQNSFKAIQFLSNNSKRIKKASGTFKDIGSFSNALFKLLHSSSSSEKRRKYSSGFRSITEIFKVKGDVKSDWFSRKVMNPTRNELQKALEPFFRFSRIIQPLTTNWTTVKEHLEHQKATIRVAGLTDGAQFYELSDTFSECVGISEDLNAPSLNDSLKLPLELAHNANELFNLLKKINDSEIEHLNDGLNFLKSKIGTDPSFSSFTVPDLKTQQFFPKFETLLKRMKQIDSYQEKVDGLIVTMIANQKRIDLSQYWTSSKTLEMLKCFRGKQMRNVTGEMEVLRKLSNQSTVAPILSMLQELTNIQSAISKLPMPRGKPNEKLKISLDLSQKFGRGVNALFEMEQVLSKEQELLESTTLSSGAIAELQKIQDPLVKEIWTRNATDSIKSVLKELKTLESLARSYRRKELNELKIFSDARKLKGLGVSRNGVEEAVEQLEKANLQLDASKLAKLEKLNLEFASHREHLTEAAESMESLMGQYSKMFEHGSKVELTSGAAEDDGFDTIFIILFSIGLLIFVTLLIVCIHNI